MPTNAFASIVLPEPGGPDSTTLWLPGSRDFHGAFDMGLSFDVRKVNHGGCLAKEIARQGVYKGGNCGGILQEFYRLL